MASKHPKTGTGKKAGQAKRSNVGFVAVPATNVLPQTSNSGRIPPSAASLPSYQVNVDKANTVYTGTIRKARSIDENKDNQSNVARRNPPRSARPIRLSSCQLCDEPDSEDMVHCDSCQQRYHFVCVNVTMGIDFISWNCANCALSWSSRYSARGAVDSNHDDPEENQEVSKLPNPPPSRSSRSSASRSSAWSETRSEARRQLKLQLQQIEEEKRLEKEYLKKKYEVLREYGSDTSTEVSDLESIIGPRSKIEEWIAETDRCGEEADSVILCEDDRSPVPNYSERTAEHPAPIPEQNMNQPVPARSQGQQFYPAGRIRQSDNPAGFRDFRNPHGGERSVPNYSERTAEHPAPIPEQNMNQPVPAGSQGQQFYPAGRIRQSNNPAGFRDFRNPHGGERSVPNYSERTAEHPAPIPEQNMNQPVPARSQGQQFDPEGRIRQSDNPAGFRDSRGRPLVNSRGGLPFGGETLEQFDPRQGSTPVRNPQPQPSFLQLGQPVVDETICVLNRSQLAARQAVSKDLPEFSGNPEDWPLFFSVFNNSTQMCGYSNEENMLRLRKCLKGRALEAVRCRLLHPSNVAGVMSTLKMLYGRPEAIVQAIIKKVRALPSPNIDKLETVVNFALTVENLVATIQACEVNDFVYNESLRFELVERLPSTLKLDWAKYSRNKLTPNLLDFSRWLYSMAEDASAVKKDGFLNVHSEVESGGNKSSTVASKGKQAANELDKQCLICKGGCSSVSKCKRFAEFGYESRWAAVRECKLCRKCLRKHNGSCKQQKPCGTNGCSYLHHPLLHTNEKQQASSPPARPATNTATDETTQQSCNVHQGQSKILFRVLPVLLYGPSKTVRTYAFVDDGSELSLMEQSLADELGVKGQRKSLCLKWTGGAQRLETSSQRISLHISSCSSQAKKYELSAVHTVESLQIRPQTLLYSELQEKYRHLTGLPLESYENVCPRVLIGLDNLSLGHPLKSREGRPHEPVAVKTRLGWTIYGSCVSDSVIEHSVNYHALQVCQCNQEMQEDLHQVVKGYFSLDSLGIVKPERLLLSHEDQRAQTLLETLTKPRNGQYESGLLWKYDSVRLPDSKGMAMKRWECLDRRMKRDPSLAEAVKAKIEDHVTKGYVRKLTEEEVAAEYPRVWYLPIFPVVNPNKPGKTRLVWDAAATVHGVSLNSVLLTGPDLLTSLLSVLIQFREFRVAVCGDIREMYHQVRMREEDQQCQRFFWRDNATDANPSTYIVQVMTFGACCSPSTAQYVKNLHAQKFKQECPAAVDAIIKRHYVDDMLVSVELEEEAIQLTRDVKRIHASAGFEIRNWTSNSPLLLDSLQESTTTEKNLSGEGTVEKILGMWWDTSSDCFTFKISSRIDELLLFGRRRPTKREVLRTLMMVFDPLGLIGHFLMILKTLLQEIWRTSIGWDDAIEDVHFEKWKTWCTALPGITKLQIPRCFRTLTSADEGNEIQIHTFVDASESGFAAAAYLRFQEGTVIECALVGSKTRVSPLKFLSIPRSELQAAVIGVRLADTVCQSLSIKVSRRFFWTDSKDVLCWLNSDHRRYSQYVAFRVSEILEMSDTREWNWVPTKQNVADEGTKWKNNADLSASSRWFRGPEFLWKSSEQWPVSNRRVGNTTEELRPHLLLHTKAVEPVIDPLRFSNWWRLLRTTAFVIRYVHNLKLSVQKKQRTAGLLKRCELIEAESYLFRTAQNAAYPDEIAILSRNWQSENPDKSFPKSSPLFRQCAFLDEKNVLRVRGRTQACPFITRDAAQQVVLPREHPITRLILLDFHKRFNHQNHTTTINEVRQRYRVPRLKAAYKALRKECQECKNDYASPQPPAMGDLPPQRLAAFTRPFTYMGVDYFGPMTVSVGRRSEKRWGVLATCLTVRAIHLELAHTLTTDSCILAIRNVMGRRGTPSTIYSDRGTNFQGASKELREAMHHVDQEELMEQFTTPDTEWVFIPPASPHMGGAWERLIRSVKSNLQKLQWRRLPTDEVLYSTLVEIENVINSRPLTEIPADDDETPVLTPNHFLLGSSNGLKSWVPYDDRPFVLRNSWRQSQVMANEFWRQWLRDYLPVITRRTKWFTKAKPIEVDDVVVIVDPRAPRNSWLLGRIIGTRPGPDGQVRSATVQTNQGIYERPAVKLAVLDVGVRDQHASGGPSAHSGGSVSAPVDRRALQ